MIIYKSFNYVTYWILYEFFYGVSCHEYMPHYCGKEINGGGHVLLIGWTYSERLKNMEEVIRTLKVFPLDFETKKGKLQQVGFPSVGESRGREKDAEP